MSRDHTSYIYQMLLELQRTQNVSRVLEAGLPREKLPWFFTLTADQI